MTVIAPLTTAFQAPPSCTTAGPHIYQIWTGKEYRYEQGPLFTKGSNCFPSSYDASPGNYYSPGICPQGYTAACTKTSIETASRTETALICCPTALSYTCLGSTDQATLGCTARLRNAAAVIGVTVISNGVTGGFTAVTETNPALAAHSIQVRFRESDAVTQKPASTVASQTSNLLITPPPASTVGTNSLQPGTNTSTPSSSGVSTAAAVGIGVGSALAAIAIAGTIGLFSFLRWRRKKQQQGPSVPPKDLSRVSTYRGSTYTKHTGVFVAPPFELSEDVSVRFELSEDVSVRYSHAHALDGDDWTKRSPTIPPVRRGTAGTRRTDRTEQTIGSELEDTAYHCPKAAELEVPIAELEVPVEGSVRSVSFVHLGLDNQGAERDARLPTPASQSSDAWSTMRKDAAVATPWL